MARPKGSKNKPKDGPLKFNESSLSAQLEAITLGPVKAEVNEPTKNTSKATKANVGKGRAEGSRKALSNAREERAQEYAGVSTTTGSRNAVMIRFGHKSDSPNSIVKYTSKEALKDKVGDNYKVTVTKIATVTKKTKAEVDAEKHGESILQGAWDAVNKKYPNESGEFRRKKVQQLLKKGKEKGILKMKK